MDSKGAGILKHDLIALDHGNDILLGDTVFTLLFHGHLGHGKERSYLLVSVFRHTRIILHIHVTLKVSKMLDLKAVIIDIQHLHALYESLIQAILDLAERYSFALQIEIQKLAAALNTHTQRQRNGNRGSGIEALGMGKCQSRPFKRSLKQPHQIQMGDPDGISRFFKQQSRHRTPPPSAGSWHRSRRSLPGSRV